MINFRKSLIIFALMVLLSSLIADEISQSTRTDTIYVIQTTDVHGNLFSYDYFKDEPVQRGLARVHSRVKELRLQHEVILIDCGDLIQGTPLSYFFNRIDTTVTNPMIKALNIMRYDSFTVGNHEIEQGLKICDRCRKQSNFPWLSANSVLNNNTTYFQPFEVIERNGIKIGILGLTTPAIPMWLDESLYPGIEWQDMVETAQKYVKILRPQVDILIGAFHSGFDETDGAEKTKLLGLPTDNASGLVAHQVPGIDLILAGHSHNMLPANKVAMENSEPLQMISGLWANKIGVAKIVLQTNNDSCWIVQKSAWLESTANFPPSPEITELEETYHLPVRNYINKIVAHTTDLLSTKDARLQDTALIDIINNAQLFHTKADISFAACFNTNITLQPGPILVKDIYSLYPYENFLYVVEMTGKQIKSFLEYNSRYFLYDAGELKINPAIKGYNFDMAEGISYNIDVTKNIGTRLGEITLSQNGKLLNPKPTYKVAMNSYRASGGGGHIPAAGAQHNKIIFKSNLEMRNILADYLEQKKKIDNKVNKNWKLSSKDFN